MFKRFLINKKKMKKLFY